MNGENFLASDVAAFIAHTREAVEIGQDEVVELRADGVTLTDFSGAPPAARRYHVDWDAGRRREGRLPLLHAQGDRRATGGVADTLRGRLSPDGGIVLDEVRLSRRTCATSTRSSSSPAGRRTMPG